MSSPNNPLTRADLQPIEARLENIERSLIATNEALAATTRSLTESLAVTNQSIINLASRLERAETTLLKDFRTYARAEKVRWKTLELRIDQLEDRVDDLEHGPLQNGDDQS
jgi:hypothetical protein